jgi:uncharacterized membrane protein HdeD (DUF308 family)
MSSTNDPRSASAPVPPPAARAHRSDMTGPVVFGLILIVVGAFFLVRQFVPQIDLEQIWPTAAIVAGVVLVVAAFVRPGDPR